MNSHVELYLHFVWATWNREDLILPDFERALWREIRHETEAQGCRLLKIGGTPNHVHILVQFVSTLRVADFIQQVKGASSLLVNNKISPDFHFKWQGAYGVFSVGHQEVPGIIDYINKQKTHHAQGTTIAAYEKTNQPYKRKVSSNGAFDDSFEGSLD